MVLSMNQSPWNDRIRLPIRFDATKMLSDVEAMQLGKFVYYDVLPLRAPAHMVDTTIAPPPPATDYADGSWTAWLDTPVLQQAKYLSAVVDTFRDHADVTLVRLLRLEAGAVVKEHCDPTLALEAEKSVAGKARPLAGQAWREHDSLSCAFEHQRPA